MRSRQLIWILLCLLCGAGAWYLWHHGGGTSVQRKSIAPTPVATRSLSTAAQVPSSGKVNTNAAQISLLDWNTNKFAGRLSNTTRTIGQLMNDGQAILLANALIDTREPLNFVFPKNLQSPGDPGAYIVQARGPIDNAFRALLAQAGVTIVSYIPNNAYLVRADAGVAGRLESSALTQTVIPYEPYYKIQSPLLPQAVEQMDLPDGTLLNLGLFADDAGATIQQIEKLGGQVVVQDRSPFGPIVRVIPPRNWTALATLSGVQIVEPSHRRSLANDLSRATVGVAANSVTATNYPGVTDLGLTGTNVIVEVNDTGIDANHPDFASGGVYGRALGVIGDAPQSLTDPDGHGTHVAGIIAGSGLKSPTVTNAPGSTLIGGVGSAGQFRGMAPGATLYSVGGIPGGLDPNLTTDQYFQEVPARTNALISNNSWVFEGDGAYDLFAASYDAAVRDALPEVTGSQPVLFVFAAGNAGNGDDASDFGSGIADSIESPATAKNVITVGAIQEARNIGNTVTNADGSPGTPWKQETSTSTRVTGFSSRGNVGIGTEGTFGRYKPDVVAPGTFIISTRSEQWDIGTYFYQNPTNNQIQTFSGLIVQPGSLWKNAFPSVPTNAVQLLINIFPSSQSPFLFTYLPIYVGLFTSPTVYDFITTNDAVSIPPDGGPNYLQSIFTSEGFLGGFNYAVSNNTTGPLSFDLFTDVITTNGSGNYLLVLSNLDNSIGTLNGSSTGPGPYYRYETGTSMSAAAVSGTLALMQEFYANACHVMPSPAMLKAMLINGARATGFYNFQAQNSINLEGWGLINLPDSVSPGITNQLVQGCSAFIQDQNPSNALATGDSQTFYVTTTNALQMRVTLAWTDPPGDPAAAIKLVNDLNLVVTNLSDPANPLVYYGNDIPAASTFNSPHATNTPPSFDSINNIENVYLPQGAGTNFSITVTGYRVNVNAVTAQTNNVVQDYALVISAGNGQLPKVMTVSPTPGGGSTTPPVVSNPTGDQQITYLTPSAVGFMTSFQMLLNQFVGANTPLLGNNTVVFSTAAPEGFGPNNWQVTVGMTNQWHFYVVTNTTGFSNAAFITFNPNAPEPDTLSVPRMGVFTSPVGNATRDADIDLYVTTDSSITNLNPAAISNCVVGTQVGAPPGGPFNGASLGRGTTEFVVDTNSQSRSPDVYYIGVKSEDQESAEYGFITIFSAAPFSTMDNNGVQTVYGVPVPMNIPDGSPSVPGKGYVFGLAIFPETVGTVTVSNEFLHQNFGDLIGALTLNGGHADVLNNHDSLGSPPGPYDLLYDDSAGGGIINSRPSDGPGSLVGYMGQPAFGVWMLTEVDDSLTQTGSVSSFTTTIQPHQDLLNGDVPFSVLPNSFLQVGFVDVPPGATDLTITVTNVNPVANPPLQLFVQLNHQPTRTAYGWSNIVNNVDGIGQQWVSVSIGPPIVSGRYFVGIYNPSLTTESGFVFATIGLPFVPAQTIYSSSGPVPLQDDAVTTNNVTVPDFQTISSMDVAIAVAHPRISDLVFHLIAPDGTRDLLVENRGGATTNGMGTTRAISNLVAQTFSGGATPPTTNVINPGQSNGVLQVSYNFYIQPDELALFYPGASTNFFDSGPISGTGIFNVPYTNSPLTIVMNPYGTNAGPGDFWIYTVESLQTNQYSYLVLTEDTNKTTTPIKFAPPPFAASNDLYYQPEQALDLYDGNNAEGVWTLEIQDDRVGATNQATLLSWQLRFNYVTTSSNSPTLLPGQPVTGTVCSNSIIWYQVTVPTNAIAATNLLLSATAPVNVWYSANNPPTTNNPGDIVLIPNSVGGVAILNFATSPALVPGGTYFLGVQGPSVGCADYGLEVDFDLVPGIPGPFAFTQPAYAVTGTGAQLNGMATPNGLPATAWFQWGPTTAYGNQTPPVGVGFGPNVVYTTNQISGLLPNVPYHFRLVVSNALTVVYGFDQILDQANVVAWGADYVGQANVPSGLSNVVAIAGAYDHSLALKNDGTAAAWGDNIYGEAAVPAGLSNMFALAGGESYSIALQNNGTVVAWGSDFYPGAGETNVPTGLNNVVMIASGQYSSLALQNIGTVVAWGGNLFNPTNVPAGLNNVVAIAGGTLHNLAIKNDGMVVAWGDNGAGQTNVPAGLTNVVAIAAGSYHNLALKNDGTVVAWGYDSAGQADVPAGLSNVVAVAAGGFHSMALKSDGSVVVWGDNSAGQKNVPLGLTNFVAIAAGYFHSLALTPQSVVNLTNVVSGPTNGVPQTNNILGGSITWYQVNVPTNADFATNILLFTVNGPLNLWFDTNTPPTTNVFLFSGTNGSYTLSTTSSPPLIPGSSYYLGVQNTNSFTVNYGIEVDFHLVIPSVVSNFGITATNNGGTNGFLLHWSGPTNYQYTIQWKTNLAQTIPWNTVLNPVINVTFTPTNGNYSWFDDGSLAGGLPPVKFYRVVANLLSGPITNSTPATNVIVAGSITPLTVAVPASATSASNILVSATGPVNVYFNQTGPPTGNTNAGDVLMLSAATSGTFVLTGSSVPPLVPGANYYLGLQNPGTSNVSFVFQVNFGFGSTPTNPPSISSITVTNVNGTNGFLLRWSGPTSYQYTIQWTTNLAPTVSWNTVLNPVINVTYTPTNGDYSWFDDGSLAGGLPPVKFYRVVANLLSGPITNSTPATNVIVAGSITPLTVIVPASATSASNILVSATGPVNVYFNQTTPPTGNTNAGDVLMLSAVTSGTFVLTGSSVPPLVPGANYYLGLQNPGTSNVSFVFQVNFGFGSTPTNPPSISSITFTNVNGTNAVLLKWVAPTNYQFQVQWATNLAPTVAWHTISNVVLTWSGVVSPTNAAYGIFQYLDDGSLTGGFGPLKFYRLIEYPYATPIPQTLTIINTAIIGGAVRFQWVAPTNYQYQVLWTTNLGLPLAGWSILANPALGLSNGVYTFTDTNQTGPATAPKFFRLLEH